ncbi:MULTISPECIES: hypothetical protein [Streptomyces]|uniref:hypothetical protein n=1 Tax=Streptomyces TaxID=1883 RepID=UPI0015C515D8|nr:hypothetical protein [Streptomyces viridochromogenes]
MRPLVEQKLPTSIPDILPECVSPVKLVTSSIDKAGDDGEVMPRAQVDGDTAQLS